jgi:hypothetical protein
MNAPSIATLRRALPRTVTLQGGTSSLGRAVCGAAFVIAMLTAPPVHAQQFRLRLLGGSPVTFAVPTEANFDAGFIAATGLLSFDVDARTAPNTLRSSTVSIRATSAVMGGSKPIGDLQWRRADLGGAWTSTTTTDAVVQTRNIQRNTLNDPWSNAIEFRTVLGWATTPPATYAPALVITLTIAAP